MSGGDFRIQGRTKATRSGWTEVHAVPCCHEPGLAGRRRPDDVGCARLGRGASAQPCGLVGQRHVAAPPGLHASPSIPGGKVPRVAMLGYCRVHDSGRDSATPRWPRLWALGSGLWGSIRCHQDAGSAGKCQGQGRAVATRGCLAVDLPLNKVPRHAQPNLL